MADKSEVVNAGLDFSDAGQNRVVLADHDAGVVTADPITLRQGISRALKKDRSVVNTCSFMMTGINFHYHVWLFIKCRSC